MSDNFEDVVPAPLFELPPDYLIGRPRRTSADWEADYQMWFCQLDPEEMKIFFPNCLAGLSGHA